MEAPSSLREYVEAQDKLDREARELFPYDFSSCSYEKGYVKQQVFSCLTCTPKEVHTQRGGMCYSCSITCHGDHELVELFNRRAFRCDCGTDRLGGSPCNIRKDTAPVNTDNKYNSNYDNVFCICKAVYNPETEEGTMFQCLLCEDWFHDRCIEKESPIPPEDDFEYYMCRACVDKQSWLLRYVHDPLFACAVVTSKQDSAIVETEEKDQDQEEDDEEIESEEEDSVEAYRYKEWVNNLRRLRGESTSSDEEYPHKKRRPDSDSSAADEDDDENNEGEEGDHGVVDDPSVAAAATTTIASNCVWGRPVVNIASQNLFLLENFRDRMCHCDSCKDRMSSCLPIMVEEEVYDPPMDNDDNESTFDAGTRAMESTLQSMPREKAIEGILAFNKLKDHIAACLKPLAESGEIVTKEHVAAFFQDRK